MKILIVYYSRTGGTEKLAEVLKKELEERGHLVDVEKIKPVKEHSFLGWWHIRMIKGTCKIQEPNIKNVLAYDVVLIGSPNWTRLSLPVAMYLREIEGLKYKNIGFFATTAAPPAVEWYIFSAYLLDFTFSGIIDKKGGRIIDSMLLSSVFKKWSFSSEYGRKAIKKFCDKITTPILRLKEYSLNRKEIENCRLLTIIFPLILVASLISHIILQAFNKGFLNWGEYFYFAIILFFTTVLFVALQERRVGIFLGKYIGGFSAVLLWTFTMAFVEPHLGRVVIWGYVAIFVLLGFFRDQKVVIFSGLLSFLGYGILFYIYSLQGVLKPVLDLVLLGISNGMVAFITHNLQQYYSGLLESQDETETARLALEVRVAARTRELRSLTEGLEEQVGLRTKELQGKIEELEKFNRLTVGRELKMIELKEEIEGLKKELEKSKK